jgi:hypothetical protein
MALFPVWAWTEGGRKGGVARFDPGVITFITGPGFIFIFIFLTLLYSLPTAVAATLDLLHHTLPGTLDYLAISSR